MAERQKGTDWYATPQDARKRKMVSLTLSDEAREALDALSAERGESKSAVVEAEILRAFARSKKK